MVGHIEISKFVREIDKLKAKSSLTKEEFLVHLVALLKDYANTLNTLETKKHKEWGVWLKIKKILDLEKEYEYRYEKKVRLSWWSIKEDVILKREKWSNEIGSIFTDDNIILLTGEIKHTKAEISSVNVTSHTSRVRDAIKKPIDTPPSSKEREKKIKEKPKTQEIAVLKCKYCWDIVRPWEKHKCHYGTSHLKTREVPSSRQDDDGDFFLSYIVADSTDSVALWYALGKNFLWAALGWSHHHSDTSSSTIQDRSYSPDPDFTSPDKTGWFGWESEKFETWGWIGWDDEKQWGFTTWGGFWWSSSSDADRWAYS